MKLIIWSFWTSDLKIDGKFIKSELFLEKTKEISENFEEYKDKISFFMLESFLKQEKLDKDIIIKWIFTDQDSYVQDTIHMENIIKKYLKYKNIARSAREHIIIKSARRPEEIKKVIDKKFSNIKKVDFEKIYIIPTWWTKWMVVWLILSALSCLDLSKISIFYWEEQKNSEKTIWLEQDNIIYSQYEYIIKNLKDHENYKAIIDLIEKNNLKNKFEKKLNFAKYAYARLNANYYIAEKIYKKAKLQSNLYVSSDTINIFEESINGIIYTWRTWRYIEFLWRVYNFTDIATNHIIKKYYNYNDNLKYEDLKDLASKDDNLKKFLNEYTIDKESLKWDCTNNQYLWWYLNTKVAIAILEYINKIKSEYQKYIDFFQKIEKLNKYRNNTIIWHGIKPVSKKIIEKIYNTDIEQDFKELFNIEFKNKILWIDIVKKII